MAALTAAALVLSPAVAIAGSTGSGGGSFTGGGGGLASADTYLAFYDNYHGPASSPGQGVGQASIDYFWDNIITRDFASFGYSPGDQGVQPGEEPRDSLNRYCGEALDNAMRRSPGSHSARVVGVYFTYALGNVNWFISGVSNYDGGHGWLDGWQVPWGDEQNNLLLNWDGNPNTRDDAHEAWAALTFNNGTPSVPAVQNELKSAIDAQEMPSNEYVTRRMVCVALNNEEPGNPAVDPSIVTDIPSADEHVKVGERVGDTVTLSLANGQSWPSGLSVKANGTLYGPFTTKPSTSTNVPAGAPVAGTASLTFNGTGSQSVNGPVVNTAGYYTWVWSIDKSQSNLLGSGFTDRFALSNETAVAVFEPQVSTRVENEFVNKGAAVPDRLTFSGAGWPAGLAVKANGTLYGPYNKPQAASGTVPAGAPVAGRATATATGPGTVTAGGNVTVSASGYYTWVWTIAQSQQSDTADALIDVDFTDGFFTAGETSIARARPSISSDVLNIGLENNEQNVVNQGQNLRDKVTVTGESASDLWMADKNGNPITIPLRYDVYGPYASVQPAGTKATGAPVLSGTKDVTNYGTYEYDLGALPNSGYYTVVWSIDTNRLSATAKTFLDPTDVTTADRTGVAVSAGANGIPDAWEVTDGTWAENETAIAPTTTVLSTSVNVPGTQAGPATVTGAQTDSAKSNGARDTVTNAVIINKDGKAVDRIFMRPADPKDLWLVVGGSPLTVPMRVDLYGPFATEGTPASMKGLAPVATSTFVANGYTGPGTAHPNGYEVAFDGLVPEATGFYTAVVRVNTEALSDVQRMHLENLGLGDQATDVPWAQDEILAATLQFDLSSDVSTKTISKGQTFADTVHVTKVGSNDVWIAPNGMPLRVPMKTQVFGPFDDLGDLTHPDGSAIADKLVAEAKWIADGFGDYKVGDQPGSIAQFDNPELAYSGYYTVVSSVDTEALAEEGYATTRSYLDDRWETGDPNATIPAAGAAGAAGNRGTDGYWSNGEQITVRMAPVVETLRQDRLIEEKDLPAPLVDNVSLRLLDETFVDAGPGFTAHLQGMTDASGNKMLPHAVSVPLNNQAPSYQGDLWLNVAGKPVEITTVNDAYGPYDVPQPKVADPSAADAAKKVGTRWLTFTRSETQTTPVIQTAGSPAADKPAMNKVPAGGQSYADAGVDPNGLWVTPQAVKPVACVGALANPALCEAFNPTEAAPKNTVTGFYTWESKVAASQQSNRAGDQPLSAVKAGTANAYFESFDSDFWIEDETASVRDQITAVSRTPETSVDPGGRFFDDVRVAQFRDNHGKFLGLDSTGWSADETTATLTVYGPLFEEPDNKATAVPEGAPVYTSATLKAENGYWIVGDADYELLEAPTKAPINPATGEQATRTWYVFTYKFDGDDRTTPFESAFGDSHERTYVDYTVPVERTPSIDIEKVDVTVDPESDDVVMPQTGEGNGKDSDNNVATDVIGDHDTKATAKKVEIGQETSLVFRVVNNGDETLKDVTVKDRTQDGPAAVIDPTSFAINGVSVEATANEDGSFTLTEVFAVGDVLTYTGTVPALKAGETHGDTATVTGVGLVTGKKVSDHDDWWAKAKTPEPRIDVEKASGGTPSAGVGNGQDRDNNIKGVADADNAATSVVVKVGQPETVFFSVTNNGQEPLSKVVITDETQTGKPVALDPASFAINGEPIEVQIAKDGSVSLPVDLAVGDVVTFTGTLPAMAAGETHGNTVVVTGVGVHSGVTVGDHDDWWATGQHPSIDIEKVDSESILAGAGNYTDAPDNKGAIFDHDTKETAKKVTVGDESTIVIRVTNNGTENLIDIKVADTTIVGDKVVAITWDDIPPVLAPGASFFGRGVLPALADGELHGDEVEVTALGQESSKGCDANGDGVIDDEEAKTPGCGRVGDKDQWHGVGVQAPTLTTQAQVMDEAQGEAKVSDVRGTDGSTVAIKGDNVRDYGQVAGQIPDDAFVTVARYFVAPDAQPVCTIPDWESGPVEIADDGSFVTDVAPVTKVGMETFVASVKTPGADGKPGTDDDVVLVAGDCYETTETVHVIDVTTEQVWKDSDGNKLANMADEYRDQINFVGNVPDGVKVTLESTANKVPTSFVEWETEPDAKTAVIDKVVFKDGAEQAATFLGKVGITKKFSGEGSYLTDPLNLVAGADVDLGALTWRHNLTLNGVDENSARYVDGAFGEASESLAPVNFGGAGGGGNQDITGVNKNLLYGGIGLLALAAVTGLVTTLRKRNEEEDDA